MMKRVEYVLFAGCVLAVMAAGAATPTSPEFRLSLKADGVRASLGDEVLSYSTLWEDEANATAKVTLSQDGTTLAENLTGEGDYDWSVAKPGLYTLTHTTYANGVVAKTLTAQFNVSEPGEGETSETGLSKFDATYVYDGNGHTLNTQALYAVTLRGATPSVSFSLTKDGPWQADPFVFTEPGVTSFWYRLSAPGGRDYTHAAIVSIQDVRLTDVTARQGYPWNSAVAVSFHASGVGLEGVSEALRPHVPAYQSSFAVVVGGQTNRIDVGEVAVSEGFNALSFDAKCVPGLADLDGVTARLVVTVAQAGLTLATAEVPVVLHTATDAAAVSGETEIAYSTDWVPGAETVRLVENGVVVYASQGSGAWPWVPLPENGSHALTLEFLGSDGARLETRTAAIDVRLTDIPDGAYAGRGDLVTVAVPETVTRIGHHAFAGCSNLVSVTVPDSVQAVGRYAFVACPKLADYRLPSGVDVSGAPKDGSGNQVVSLAAAPHADWKPGIWDGCVDLTYVVAGAKIVGQPAVRLVLTATDGVQTYAAKTMVGDTSVGAGTHTVKWDATKDLGEARPTSLAFRAELAPVDGSAEEVAPLEGDYPSDLTLASFRTTRGGLCSAPSALDFATAVPLRYEVQADGTAVIVSGAYVDGVGRIELPDAIDGHALSGVASDAFPPCEGGATFVVSDSVGSFDLSTAATWSGLNGLVTTLEFGVGTTNFSIAAFRPFVNLTRVVFGGGPEGLSDALLAFLRSSGLELSYPEAFADLWSQALARFASAGVTVVSAAARTNDATVLDVVYRITGATNALPARALFFKDNVRSFANVVLPRTFADGTENGLGAAMAPAVDHHFAWKVNEDWQIDLAKVRAEVMILPGELLPLKFFTIPANGPHAAISVSRNALAESRVLDALFWLYAGGEADLTLKDGVLTCGDAILAEGATPNGAEAVAYLFGKMGLRLLEGEELDYVNDCARLGFSPQGVRQYAVREAK